MAKGGDPYQVLEDLPPQDLDAYMSDPEKYGDIVQDLRYIYEAYEEYWENEPLQYLSHDGRKAEFPFEVEVGDDILVKGTIDAVTKHRKMNWLTEHKNHRNIPNDDERWRSLQSVVYIKIIAMLGWWTNLEGTCWDYIRSKAPSRPELLKDGSISKRRIDTLPNVVRTVLKKQRHRPEYKTLVDSAVLNMSTYFQRVYTPIKKTVIAEFWGDFLTTAAEMRDADILKAPVRTVARHCSWCQYEPLCRASLTGGDEEYLIEHEYAPSTYGEQHEEASD